MKKEYNLIFNVGINDADYVTTKYEYYTNEDGKRKKRLIWVCPYSRRWKNMLERCYSEKYQQRSPTYRGCSVCDEWLTFSKFKEWMVTQDWEGKTLDKDILYPGNKVYSPETCVFISRQVNSFVVECGAARGEYPIGAIWDIGTNRFRASCSCIETGKIKFLGHYNTWEESHAAWLQFKLKQAKLLAEQQSDPRVAEALIKRYENYKI